MGISSPQRCFPIQMAAFQWDLAIAPQDSGTVSSGGTPPLRRRWSPCFRQKCRKVRYQIMTPAQITRTESPSKNVSSPDTNPVTARTIQPSNEKAHWIRI